MIIRDFPTTEYFAHEAVNSTHLKLILDSPYDFKEASNNGESTQTPSTIMGTAIHMFLLEPDRFEKTYIYYSKRRAGKAWNQFKNDHPDKIILPQKHGDHIQKLAEKLESNLHLKFLLASGESEITGIVKEKDSQVLLKARADKLTRNVIWDVKMTNEGMKDEDIYRTIKRYKYHFSAAHYLKVFSQALNKDFRFGWVFVEGESKSKSIRIRSLLAPQLLIENGMVEHKKALNLLTQCRRENSWPGYSDEVEELQLPTWAEENKS